MTRLSTFIIYLLQLILYCLISGVSSQDGVKNVNVKVLNATCQVDDGNICKKKYLQICFFYEKKMDGCDGKNALCLYPSDVDTDFDSTYLSADIGKNYSYSNFMKIEDMKQIIVKITFTRQTKRLPDSTACEHDESNRTMTKQGFKVVTTSADGSYQLDKYTGKCRQIFATKIQWDQTALYPLDNGTPPAYFHIFELLIENICKTPNLSYCGNTCKFCVSTTTVSSKMDTTSDVRSNITTSMTFSTLNTTLRSTSTFPRDRTTTSFRTNPNRSDPTSSLPPIATSEESSTIFDNDTNNSTISSNNFENSNTSHQSKLLTVIIAAVCSIVVLLVVVITIYICYRKHNRKSRTTPAEDDKNHLVNDYIEGEDRHSNTDISNGGHNNTINLHIENESCDKMAIVTTETDDIVNKIDEGNGSMSSKQNVTNDISSEIVNNELEDKKMRNIMTEAEEDTEQSNNGVDTVSSVHNDTDDPCTHQHKKNKKKKQKRSDAEEDKPSISEDLSNRKFSNEIPNESNNGYIPDDEHSDAGLSNENEKKNKIKSDEMSSHVDNKENDDQDIESKSKSNSQNDDIKLGKSIQNDDSSIGVQKNEAMTNSEDVSRNDVPSSDNGDVPNQAQFNGHFHHQEISRKEIENITEVKVETIMHGKMSEMKRDITEHTHNNITCINQVKEEVSVLKQDMQEKLFQHKNEIQEQINRNKKDTEKAEGKRQRKMQKLKDQIQECNGRLKNFEDRINEYTQNQELLEKKVEASGGKPDAGRREIIETENEIQKLRDEMNRLSENLRQQISQQKGVSSLPDTPLFTKTTHVSKGPPDSNDLLRSRTASDDALYRKHSDSIAATDQHSELEKKRKKKKRKRTPSIRFPGDGTVHIQHEDNTIDIEQIGPMEVQQTNRGIRLTGGNVEIDIKSPRKKTSSPQKDQTT